MQLVIVESPAKAKTIEKYLGRDFKVLASYGHVRDLPPKDGSVNPDDGFAMQWQLYPDKAKRLKDIQDAAKQADRLILATDPDSDRVGVACPLPAGGHRLLNGNEVAALLTEFRLSSLKDAGILPEAGSPNAAVVKSLVTTPLERQRPWRG